MSRKTVYTVIFPIAAAMIWGTAFSYQSIAADHLGAFTVNALRCILASAVLGLVLLGRRMIRPHRADAEARRATWLGGLVCGVLLWLAANLQQLGLADTDAGKAGFITALYVVLVPVFSVVLGRKVTPMLWLGITLAVAGLYLLCVKEGFALERSDVLILLCAVAYAFYILAVDHFVKKTDSISLSAVHFLVCFVISAAIAVPAEKPQWTDIRACLWPVIYIGVFSSALAYTLELAAQKEGSSVTVTLLLSLESVFSVLAGAIILGERLAPRELLGCALMFCAVILAQLPEGARRSLRRGKRE